MTPAIKWTTKQWAGISTVGHSLLVSAAAGSGKTAVLAERCAYLICDAKEPCDVDQLLVVTFTESAAAEMKTRIQQALRRRMLAKPNDRLARQISLAEHAQVSTIHGFCFRLLKQNFTLAGIDPEFEILEPEEANLLRQEIAADLFHTRYETDESGDFQRLIDAYGDGNDEALIRRVIQTDQLLGSLIDPASWIARSDEAMREAAEKPLEQSALGMELLRQIGTQLEALERRARDVKKSIGALGRGVAAYEGQIDLLLPYFAHWRDVLQSSGLDMLRGEIEDFRGAKMRAPAIKADVPNKDLAKKLLDGVKNAVFAAPLSDFLSVDSEGWRDGMKRVAPHAKVFLGLVSEFSQQYAVAKASQRVLDFVDLERMTLNVLTDRADEKGHPSALATSLHEQFRHVLVDEYQDINPIQDAILKLVSWESVAERDANLFCVGDVKQSIFRFRLAEPRRFLDRHEAFSKLKDVRDGEVIDLRENFRSRAPLLSAINEVFTRLMRREAAEIEYDESHRLVAGRMFGDSGGKLTFSGAPMELHFLPEDPVETAKEESAQGAAVDDADELERTDYEAILVARRIREMMGEDGASRVNVWGTDGTLRAAEYGDIVILLRAMYRKADRFADVLRAHGIPVHSEAGGGLFEAVEIRDLLSLLKMLDNQQLDIPLAAVLRSPIAEIPDADDALAMIRAAYNDGAGAGAEPTPFHQAVVKYAREKKDELAAHLRDFLKRVEAWRDLANKRPVAELVWHIFQETGYLAYCGGLEDGSQRVANLLELHQRAGQFGSFQKQGLYRFLRFLENLESQSDTQRPAPAGQPEHVVRIMSIHRSKGLEFPIVILPDLGKQHNVSDTRGTILTDRQTGLGMAVVDEQRLIRYPSLASILVRQNLLYQTIAEELRLLYVAMTRAKEHLILVGTCSEADRKNWVSRWTNREGSLPADDVQGGKRVVDWLGPVAAMTSASATPVFKIVEHSAEELVGWKNPRNHRADFSEEQKKLARLEPLEVDPPVTEEFERLIRRFQTPYAHAALTKVPATMSVTALAKDRGAGEAIVAEIADPAAGLFQPKLDLPRFFVEQTPLKATDKGTATHTVLQYFDFSKEATRAEIDRQIAGLVSRKLLLAEFGELVDREAILWFLNEEVGRTVRENYQKVIREIPFALLKGAEGSGELLDGTMIRGRIDLLVPSAKGLFLVDYKTDNVFGGELEKRVEVYSRQMKVYVEAIKTVARRKIDGVYLVFFGPKKVVELKL